MAKVTRPEFFYHPVVGALPPTAVREFLSRATASPAPSIPAQNYFPVAPKSNQDARLPMTLSKTAICAVTGEVCPQTLMIRFVISPDGLVYPDLTGKLPGVFLWLKADLSVIKKAIWRNSFAAKSKQTVTIPDNLIETVITGLKKQSLQSLSLLKRAGELLSGFTKVDEAIRLDGTAVYIVANDAQENGREKLERLAKHNNITILDIWSSAELSSALGGENINHIALSHGGLTQSLLETVTKLNALTLEK
jgi:predicted RNA-binding protein YlxR (DUF448 family)